MCIDAIEFGHPDADAQVSTCAAHAIYAIRTQSSHPEPQELRHSTSSSNGKSSGGGSGGNDSSSGDEQTEVLASGNTKPVVVPTDNTKPVVVSDSCANNNKPGVVSSGAFDFQVAVGALPNPTASIKNSISALEVDFMLMNSEASSTIIPDGATVWMYASF